MCILVHCWRKDLELRSFTLHTTIKRSLCWTIYNYLLLHFLLSNVAFLMLIMRDLRLLLKPCYLSSVLSLISALSCNSNFRLKLRVSFVQRSTRTLPVKSKLTAKIQRNFLSFLTVQFITLWCSQITGLLMSIHACVNILVWTGRQNNQGPNSHEDCNLFRLVWSISWPTSRGETSFSGCVTLVQ